MLGDKYSLKLNYENKTKDLFFTFKTMKNIFTLTGENPFSYLQNFTMAEDKYDYLASILYCLVDGNIQLGDITNNILTDEDNIKILNDNLILLIQTELTGEIEEDHIDKSDNKDSNDDSDKEEGNEIKGFIDYWNYYYYIATVQLRMTKDEFLDSSVREIKTLSKIHSNYFKNSLIDTYITVVKAKNNNENKEPVIEDKPVKKAKRFIDLF